MAKKKTEVEAGGFTYLTDIELPERKGGGRSSAETDQIVNCPVGAAFMTDVFLPEDFPITDEIERDKALKEMVRKASNSVTGRIRRLTQKDEYATRNYETRTVFKHEQFGTGVVVKRNADTTA